MTLNARLAIKNNNTSMPVTILGLRNGGLLLQGHSLFLGDAYASHDVELISDFTEVPVRVLIQSHTIDGRALAIPYMSVRRN
ncbi:MULTISPECIES: hypothetical protein [Rhizobium]|uniref:Uncharacterized protein n=1 Tax=Rhizobium tropici TaxID=398 RepID=A0A6P1C9A6_RHITR|nr:MULTISPECIES: hypothetical protein [Rhizobium]AGB71058.1 hypothetical protein RTCIAT899_CH08340 [Rhizobium tropici CIAT 899]MBB4242351.1 hypothetical protein [Rhizobium tropici]MBB5593994.1 hypothetical protein [Rhizobium tropici]MBB6492885.1 hypothetical protein [Rhizobium tropici]NEV13327.1 hypothetical protein [Rhizobium tropici]